MSIFLFHIYIYVYTYMNIQIYIGVRTQLDAADHRHPHHDAQRHLLQGLGFELASFKFRISDSCSRIRVFGFGLRVSSSSWFLDSHT